jgi:hypothetical protein
MKEAHVTATANDPRLEDAFGQVTHWFFDDYLSRWTSVVNGTCQDGPDFILDYWGCPMHVSSLRTNRWLTEPREVTGLLAEMQARVREAGYTHTAVLDSRVTVFHPRGAAIEVIWSRRAGQTEIERLAVQYEVVRNRDGWRARGVARLGHGVWEEPRGRLHALSSASLADRAAERLARTHGHPAASACVCRFQQITLKTANCK